VPHFLPYYEGYGLGYWLFGFAGISFFYLELTIIRLLDQQLCVLKFLSHGVYVTFSYDNIWPCTGGGSLWMSVITFILVFMYTIWYRLRTSQDGYSICDVNGGYDGLHDGQPLYATFLEDNPTSPYHYRGKTIWNLVLAMFFIAYLFYPSAKSIYEKSVNPLSATGVFEKEKVITKMGAQFKLSLVRHSAVIKEIIELGIREQILSSIWQQGCLGYFLLRIISCWTTFDLLPRQVSNLGLRMILVALLEDGKIEERCAGQSINNEQAHLNPVYLKDHGQGNGIRGAEVFGQGEEREASTVELVRFNTPEQEQHGADESKGVNTDQRVIEAIVV